MKKKKQMTIEQLARMVQQGFGQVTNQMVTKVEFRDFQRSVIEEFERVHADINDLKITLGPLIRVVAA